MSSPRKSVAELLGLPLKPKEGRNRLIAATVELVYRHGFNAVGVDQVVAVAGVTKTTFYKHFDSKDDLMVATVRQRDEWESQAWNRAVKELAGDDPRQQLRCTIDVLDHWFNAPDFRGCLFLNAAVEFPNPHDPVHQAGASHKRALRDRFRDLARAAGATKGGSEQFADCYSALIEGALVLRQACGRDDAARAIRPAIEQLIDAFLPRSPASAEPARDERDIVAERCTTSAPGELQGSS